MLNAKPYPRTRNLFNPDSKTPYRLSRSRLENFLNCPRCFYMDRRLGVEPPQGPSFTLNSAVDELLKKEFDEFRRLRRPHPLCVEHGVDAIPFAHPMLGEWREVFKGVQHHHSLTNFLMFGAVDDIWETPAGELMVVDYKATSTDQIISLEGEYRQAYKRQMEIYQWLLRKQKLKVSNTGYFVYCNADRGKKNFNSKLEFSIQLIPYAGNDGWVEEAVVAAHQCLMAGRLPPYSPSCSFCNYRQASRSLEEDVPTAVSVFKSAPAKKQTPRILRNLLLGAEVQSELF